MIPDDEKELWEFGIVLTEKHIQNANLSWDVAPVTDNSTWRYPYSLWKESGKPRGVGWWEESGKYTQENFEKFMNGRIRKERLKHS